MSGPKTGRYTLTPEQRRRLEEQLRKAREEQIRREKLAAEKGRLKAQQKKSLEILSKIVELPDSGEMMSRVVAKVKAVLADCEKAFSADRIEKVVEAEKKLAEVTDELQLCLNLYLNELYEKKSTETQAEDILIANGFSVVFSKIEDKRRLVKDKTYKKIQDALNSLGRLHLTADSVMELDRIRNIAQGIEDLEFLGNFYAVTVYPFVSKCIEYNGQYERYIAEYMELHAEYSVLVSEQGQMSDKRYEEFSMDNLEKLRNLVNQMKLENLKEQEEEYISNAIDAAMREMGYSLVGTRDIIKKSGKKTRKELYHLSGGKVIDVTYSATGQIAMELGAADVIDRDPTHDEAQKLTEDMELFCDEYKAIERILERKGILRKNIQMLPPSAEYAQVINTEDYVMLQEVERYELAGKGHVQINVNSRKIGVE